MQNPNSTAISYDAGAPAPMGAASRADELPSGLRLCSRVFATLLSAIRAEREEPRACTWSSVRQRRGVRRLGHVDGHRKAVARVSDGGRMGWSGVCGLRRRRGVTMRRI